MEKHFKVIFNPSSNSFSGFKMKVDSSAPKDVYYDEIIIYDGGGADGYGDDKEKS